MTLTLDQVRNLLSSRESAKTSWLSTDDKKALLKAIDAGKATVLLKGREFTIKHISNGRVFVKVSGNFTPCGTFSVKKMRMDTSEFVI